MTNKLLFTSFIIAVVVNGAIIGCNRQGVSDKKESQESNTPAVTTDTVKGAMNVSQNNVTPLAPIENKAPEAGGNLKTVEKAPQKSPYEKSEIVIKTFKVDAPAKGYGYDISIDKKPYLHQPNIPAMPGNDGFSTEINARRAAELVVYKIRHNIMPPSLDQKELDSLGLLK